MLGRSFMIGIAALGISGAEHIHYILQDELSNVMEQLCCKDISDLKLENVTLTNDFFLQNIRK